MTTMICCRLLDKIGSLSGKWCLIRGTCKLHAQKELIVYFSFCATSLDFFYRWNFGSKKNKKIKIFFLILGHSLICTPQNVFVFFILAFSMFLQKDHSLSAGISQIYSLRHERGMWVSPEQIVFVPSCALF